MAVVHRYGVFWYGVEGSRPDSDREPRCYLRGSITTSGSIALITISEPRSLDTPLDTRSFLMEPRGN